MKPIDSIKQVITYIKKNLHINDAYLAGYLGVTEKSLNDWKKLGLGDLTPKAKRVIRLYEVIDYISNNYHSIDTSVYKQLIENGRITIDPNDDEDGSTSLLNFIIEEPSSKTWVPQVKEAVENYFENSHQGEKVEKHRKIQMSF